jgi:hypothetical protein
LHPPIKQRGNQPVNLFSTGNAVPCALPPAGYPCTVERAASGLGPWEPFTVVVADVNGNFQVDDPNDPPAPMRFYRVTYP